MDQTPEETLTAFLEAMDRSQHEGSARAEAFEMLAAESQEMLRERSRRATSLAGRDIPPWQMLAQGRFRLRIDLSRAEIETSIQGEEAFVDISAPRQHARIRLVLEDNAWRLVL